MIVKRDLKKAVLLIALGDLSLNIITWAKQLGLVTIVTNRDKNAQSMKIADFPLVVDGNDTAKLKRELTKLKREYSIIGIYTGLELAKTVSIVGKLLNLPVLPIKTVRAIEDKIKMKRILEQNNIPTANYTTAKTFSEAVTKSRMLGFPLVLKPPSSSGSQGVTIVKIPKNLKSAFREAKKYSKSSIVIEKYLEGSMHDVNGIFYKNKFYKAGVIDRLPNIEPHTYPVGTIDPSILDRESQTSLYKITEAAGKAFGIKFGPFKSDLILTKSGPKILEVAPRFHGDVTTSWTTPISTGINPIKAYLKLLLTGKVDQSLLTSKMKRFSGFKLIMCKPGVIISIKGINAAERIKGIQRIFVRKQVGDSVQFYRNNSDIAGLIVASAKTPGHLAHIFSEAAKKIKIKTRAEKL